MAVRDTVSSWQSADAQLEKHATLMALSIVMLGAVIRVYGIGAKGLIHDEVTSVWLARHSVQAILHGLLTQGVDATPPLFPVLLNLLLRIGEDPFVIRMPSLLAGVLMVWVTYHLAAALFDKRTACLSAFFMAIAPLHVQFSQVARAYAVADLWAALSLYFFANLIFRQRSRWRWIGLVASSAIALYSFYLTLLVVLFENALVAFLWLRNRSSRSLIRSWLISQIAVGIAAIPLSFPFFRATEARGQEWLAHPGLVSIVKSAILFSTGDPSDGTANITPARAMSGIVVVAVCALGAHLFIRNGYLRRFDEEGRRIAFLLGAVAIPWLIAFSVSQVRPIYHDKYLLFLMPPLVTVVAWILVRSRPPILSWFVGAALVTLTLQSLLVLYTAPAAEPWQQEVQRMRAAYQRDDQVVVSPGYYYRPFSYYFFDREFPDARQPFEYSRTLTRSRAVVFVDGEIRIVDAASANAAEGQLNTVSPGQQRVWLVSGYAQVDPIVLSSLEQRFGPIDLSGDDGASVRLLQ